MLSYESLREASAGGAEHVTDGRTPEPRVRLSRDDGSESIVGASELLTAEQRQELARTRLHLERLFDTPVSTMQEQVGPFRRKGHTPSGVESESPDGPRKETNTL